MHVIHLKEYGRILTGRELGKSTLIQMDKKIPHGEEVSFDLTGVLSMGSSFGDEVFPKIALRQNKTLAVRGANPSVQHCLQLVAADAGISINME